MMDLKAHLELQGHCANFRKARAFAIARVNRAGPTMMHRQN